MNAMKRGIIVVAFASTTLLADQTPSIEPQWTVRLQNEGAPVVSAWSPTGTCVAVATDTVVHVIDVAGHPLWTWSYRQTNHLIHPSSALSVSPACDAVALGGAVDYRYVWIAERSGRRAFVKVTGTPSSVKFSLDGNVIAVATAAPHGYLLLRDAKIRWSGPMADLPVKWPTEVVRGRATSFEFARDDVEELFGVPPCCRGEADDVSDDGEWRVVEVAPYRGPGTAFVELWGPGSLGYRDRFVMAQTGTPRWHKEIGCPSVQISRDGMFVLVKGDPEHPEYNWAGTNENCADEPATYVFDRQGNLVLTWPHPVVTWPRPEGLSEMSDALFARTGHHLRLRGRPNWDYLLSLPNGVIFNQLSTDGRMLLVSLPREVRLYRQPESMRSADDER